MPRSVQCGYVYRTSVSSTRSPGANTNGRQLFENHGERPFTRRSVSDVCRETDADEIIITVFFFNPDGSSANKAARVNSVLTRRTPAVVIYVTNLTVSAAARRIKITKRRFVYRRAIILFARWFSRIIRGRPFKTDKHEKRLACIDETRRSYTIRYYCAFVQHDAIRYFRRKQNRTYFRHVFRTRFTETVFSTKYFSR